MRTRTTKFEEAVYEYTDFKAISFDLNEMDCVYILGADVPEDIVAANRLNLIAECGYIFRKTLKGGYIAARVTMHPKTAANLRRGSNRYGSGAIMREILEV